MWGIRVGGGKFYWVCFTMVIKRWLYIVSYIRFAIKCSSIIFFQRNVVLMHNRNSNARFSYVGVVETVEFLYVMAGIIIYVFSFLLSKSRLQLLIYAGAWLLPKNRRQEAEQCIDTTILPYHFIFTTISIIGYSIIQNTKIFYVQILPETL